MKALLNRRWYDVHAFIDDGERVEIIDNILFEPPIIKTYSISDFSKFSLDRYELERITHLHIDKWEDLTLLSQGGK